MEKIIIDRFEGDIAVCERDDCSMINIQKSKLPKGVRVGNILIIDDSGNIKIDVQEELRRKEQILRMQQQIFGD
ncbi:MAG: DUF3006 domain-containing protein [Clostridiales bacterium]|nr:DUF3006 domain-containing protein [Clostridiales bacterium]